MESATVNYGKCLVFGDTTMLKLHGGPSGFSRDFFSKMEEDFVFKWKHHGSNFE